MLLTCGIGNNVSLVIDAEISSTPTVDTIEFSSFLNLANIHLFGGPSSVIKLVTLSYGKQAKFQVQIAPMRDNKNFSVLLDILLNEDQGFVKISSGWSKGLKILTPEGMDTRPTRERVRQAAINMLQPWIAGSSILDLFAGSGAVGIELVSRGGYGAKFIESSSKAIKCLQANTLEAQNRAIKQGISLDPWKVMAGDVYILIKQESAEAYDLIWADPPYEMVPGFLEAAGTEIARILKSGGVFVLESGGDTESFMQSWGGRFRLELLKQRRFGVSLISIWQKN